MSDPETESTDETADEAASDPEPEKDPGPAPEPEPAPEPAQVAPPLVRSDLAYSKAHTRSRIFLAIIAVLVLGIVIGRVSATGDEDDDESGGDEAEAPAAEGLPFPVGDQDRTRYWGFAALTPVVVDTFDRANDPQELGVADTGQAWDALRGTWGVRENRATVRVGGGGDRPRMAATPGGSGDGLTEVTMAEVEPGAGLLFRFVDDQNYWSVTLGNQAGSWLLNRVVDGRDQLVAEVTGPTEDGTTVSVVQNGPRLRILFEGEDAFTVADPALSDALRGGLVASAESIGAARWDRFLVMRFRSAPDTTTP